MQEAHFSPSCLSRMLSLHASLTLVLQHTAACRDHEFSFPWNRVRIQKKTWCMGSHAGADYSLTLCPLQSRLQRIYHGQPYARVDLNPMPESTFIPQPGTLDLASGFQGLNQLHCTGLEAGSTFVTYSTCILMTKNWTLLIFEGIIWYK